MDTLAALNLSDTAWPKLEQLFLMETSRLSGRVPQASFVAGLHKLISVATHSLKAPGFVCLTCQACISDSVSRLLLTLLQPLSL